MAKKRHLYNGGEPDDDELYASSGEALFNVNYTAKDLGKMPESLKRSISEIRCIVDRDSLDRKVDLIWK